jgi:hypothetical protein
MKIQLLSNFILSNYMASMYQKNYMASVFIIRLFLENTNIQEKHIGLEY